MRVTIREALLAGIALFCVLVYTGCNDPEGTVYVPAEGYPGSACPSGTHFGAAYATGGHMVDACYPDAPIAQ